MIGDSIDSVIESFKSKEAKRIWAGEVSKQLPRDIQEIILRKLRMLNNAKEIKDLKIPSGNRLETLKGRRSGQHSMRINDQWRICFVWLDNNAHDVDIVDYH